MEWTASMICEVCRFSDEGHVFEADTRDEALGVLLDCPNCDTADALRVEESTLRRHRPDD